VFKGSWFEFARLDGMLQATGMFDNKWQDNWHDTGRVSVCRINLLMKNRGIGNLDWFLIMTYSESLAYWDMEVLKVDRCTMCLILLWVIVGPGYKPSCHPSSHWNQSLRWCTRCLSISRAKPTAQWSYCHFMHGKCRDNGDMLRRNTLKVLQGVLWIRFIPLFWDV